MTSSPPSSSGAGFPRRSRLLTGAEFDAVFEQRKRMHGAHFNAHVAANAYPHPRLGLIVSKRVSKKSVARNRLKRMVRDSFRRRQHQLGRIDYVIIAKPEAVEALRVTLRRELDKLWDKARRRCEKSW